jgi:hypothetical protein
MKSIIGVLFLSLSCSLSQAQTSTSIHGLVLDALTRTPLANANILLLNPKDTTIIRKAVSTQGGFVISEVAVGHYQLKVSHLGYQDSVTYITISRLDSIYHTGTLVLRKTPKHLSEVVVKGTVSPMSMKNDTILYDPTAFNVKQNATVEELLRKLPGIVVDGRGNVTVGGKAVQKVLVDGKEFFSGDPRLATKNLLVDMVEKVETFDEKSEKARITGIPDPRAEKVINLRLKPDRKRGMFGNTQVSYGTQHRYTANATVNYFERDTYLSGIVNSTNGGNLQGGTGPLHSQQNDFAVNYRDRWSPRVEITSEYRGQLISSKNIVGTHRQTFLTDSSLLQDKQVIGANTNGNHPFNLGMSYVIDSMNRLEIITSSSLQQNTQSNSDATHSSIIKGNTITPVNSAGSYNYITAKSLSSNAGLKYYHRFRKRGRFLEVGAGYGYTQSRGKGKLESITRFYVPNGTMTDSLIRNQRSGQSAAASNFAIDMSYTEPVGNGQLLDFSYKLEHFSNWSNQQTLLYDPITGKYDAIDSTATNAFLGKNDKHLFGLSYHYFRKRIQYQLGISVQYSSQMNDNSVSGYISTTQYFTNIFPRAFLIYTFDPQKRLQITYDGQSRQPAAEQLQPIADYTNPLLVRQGNPDLKQEFGNIIRLDYRAFDLNRSRQLLWQVTFSNSINKIMSSTYTNNQGIQELQYVNVNGNYNLHTDIVYGFPLDKDRKGNVSVNTSLAHSREINFINGQRNLQSYFGWEQQLQLGYRYQERMTADFAAGLSWRRSTYSNQVSQPGTFFSHNYDCNLLYEWAGGFILSSGVQFRFNNPQQNLPGQHSVIWNATLVKMLFSNRSGQLKFSVFDILNDKRNFGQSTGDNYIETTESEIVRRLLAMSFVYHFRMQHK